MSNAFNKAWILLKNRGYEMMPDDEQEENRAHRVPMEDMKNPMEEHKRRALAEMMEEEGEDEMPPPRGPPSDIGMAGSMSPQKPLEPNPFQMKRKPSL